MSGYSIGGLPRGYRYPGNAVIASFAGGLNIRDEASELAPIDVIDAWNITFDERGGAASRLGYIKYNGVVYDGAAKVRNLFWSRVANTSITQVGLKLYKGTSTSSVKTFTTTELVTFAEMAGKIVACHPTDGLFTSTDGTTWTAVADADAPKGTCVAVWQNKLWVGGLAATPTRVQFSNAGDPTNWTATDFVDIREINDDTITALHVASGEDIVGNALLYAFKAGSWYVISDSTTGAYNTIDATVGAANPVAVVGVGAWVYALSRRGIYRAAGAQAGAQNVSDKLAPLWDPGEIDLTQAGIWAAGRRKNRALFSLTRLGSTANDLALELHTEQGWLAPRSDAMSCYMSSAGTSDLTYGGSPTVNGQVFQLSSGGTDNGAAISYRLQTRWMQLLGDYQAMTLHVRLRGRGTGITCQARHDFHDSGDTFPVDLQDSSSIDYNTGVDYDTGVDYYVPSEEPTAILYGVGACRQLSLLFTGSTSATASAPQVLGSGTAPQVGSFALFSVEALFMRLGLG